MQQYALMAQQPDTPASSAGHAQQDMDNDAATAAFALRLASTHHRQSSNDDTDVAITSGVAVPSRSLLLGLQAPIKLYPPNDSSSKAAHSGSTFAQYCLPSTHAQQNTSSKWCSELPHKHAEKSSSIHTSKHASDNSSSAPAIPQQTHELRIPQQAAAVASWKPPQSSTAALDPAISWAPISYTAGNSVTCSKHGAGRPLQLHKQQERDRNMGVLLMERCLAQLSQALEEAQALQEQYAQQLVDANAAHKQRLGNMQVGGAVVQKTERAVCCRAGWQQQLCSCVRKCSSWRSRGMHTV
jgi:hypothetical protein